jgi:hypothetical protein
MANLCTELHDLIENHMNAAGLTDLVIGTVFTVSPLTIEITPDFIVDTDVLYLTEAVTERKIDLSHTHEFPHTHIDTQGGTSVSQSTTTTAGDGTLVLNPVDASPTPSYSQGSTYQQSGIINPGLAKGDAVLMLRIMAGQAYLVLSRVVNAS